MLQTISTLDGGTSAGAARPHLGHGAARGSREQRAAARRGARHGKRRHRSRGRHAGMWSNSSQYNQDTQTSQFITHLIIRPRAPEMMIG